MGIYSLFMDKKSQYCQDVTSADLIYRFNKSNQNRSKLFCGCGQIDSKVYVERQKTRRDNTTLKDNFGELTFPNIKTKY